MGLQQIRDLYLSGKWTKNDLHTLRGFTNKDISLATKGLKRRVKFGEVSANFDIPSESLEDRLSNVDLTLQDLNITLEGTEK